MKAIITGGGTGGHIYPAISVGNRLKEKGWELLYIGSENGLENKIVPENGINLETIEVAPLIRKISLQLFKTFYKSSRGYFQSRKIIKKFNPDIVFGTGGFVAGPVVLAGCMKKVPSLIHEQNVYPGLTNKLLSIFVEKIALNYEEAVKYFPLNIEEKSVVTGNPIRKNIIKTKKYTGIKKLGLVTYKKTLLVFGGSQGSKSINEAMYKVCKYYYNSNKLQIVYITGNKNYKKIKTKLKKKGIDLDKNIKLKAYLNNMEWAYAAADLVVYRAGATGLSEITARGIPAILIPYPYAAGDHQTYNARNLEKEGAAEVISDDKLNGRILLKKIKKLLGDTSRLKEMRGNSKKLGIPDATEKIVNLIEEIVEI
ncbi:MAG: undecaprenyldiphospho-muramoylpentapeptide beta-N-acetylglucosaminyltransferase [Bacillota bacterium]